MKLHGTASLSLPHTHMRWVGRIHLQVLHARQVPEL
jgi:hypothetical protein